MSFHFRAILYHNKQQQQKEKKNMNIFILILIVQVIAPPARRTVKLEVGELCRYERQGLTLWLCWRKNVHPGAAD